MALFIFFIWLSKASASSLLSQFIITKISQSFAFPVNLFEVEFL